MSVYRYFMTLKWCRRLSEIVRLVICSTPPRGELKLLRWIDIVVWPVEVLSMKQGARLFIGHADPCSESPMSRLPLLCVLEAFRCRVVLNGQIGIIHRQGEFERAW